MRKNAFLKALAQLMHSTMAKVLATGKLASAKYIEFYWGDRSVGAAKKLAESPFEA